MKHILFAAANQKDSRVWDGVMEKLQADSSTFQLIQFICVQSERQSGSCISLPFLIDIDQHISEVGVVISEVSGIEFHTQSIPTNRNRALQKDEIFSCSVMYI